MKYFLLTFDVEDWFQVENFKTRIPFSSWPFCESRVERNTHTILDFLDSARIQYFEGYHPNGTLKATFFVLGWIAERMPGLIKEIRERGHEVASHGYNHKLSNRCSGNELKEDLKQSKELLEDILGKPVLGYRAPSFSITEEALAILEECGYVYDSSYNSFSANKRHGRIKIFPNGAGISCKTRRSIYELPISNFKFGGYTVPTGGGAYFRLIPVRLFAKMALSVIRDQSAYLFYLHPWEADADQPKVQDAPAFLRFRHYTNIPLTLKKLSFLLEKMKSLAFVSCSDYIQQTAKPFEIAQ